MNAIKVRERKEKLEKDISDMVSSFEKETGIMIAAIHLGRGELIWKGVQSKEKIIKVEVDTLSVG